MIPRQRIRALIGCAVAVALVGVFIAVVQLNRGMSDATPDDTLGRQLPSASTAPACRPKLTESGFAQHEDRITWVILVDNPCTDVVVGFNVVGHAVDATGRELSRAEFVANPIIGAILPGRRAAAVGVSGLEADGGPPRIKSITYTDLEFKSAPATHFASWAQNVSLDDVRMAASPQSNYGLVINLRVATQPDTALLCEPLLVVVTRDRTSGAIVFGRQWRIQQRTISDLQFTLPQPVERTVSELYLMQGTSHPGPIDGCTPQV
jgi:hypothetical protein